MSDRSHETPTMGFEPEAAADDTVPQLKRARLEPPDLEAAMHPQLLWSNRVASSPRHYHESLHPQSQLQTFYQPSTVGPLVFQSGHTVHAFPLPSHPMPSSGGPFEQMQHASSADQETHPQLHVPPPQNLAPENILQTPCPPLDNEGARQPIPLEELAKHQPHQLPSGTEGGSPSFVLWEPPSREPHHTLGSLTLRRGNKDDNLAQSLQTVWRDYWTQVVTVLGQRVAPSMHTKVIDALCSHRFQWASNRLYREVSGIDKNKRENTDIKTLSEWMYGTEDTTLATWRDTLSTKEGDDKKVPWVGREKLIALYVIFTGLVKGAGSRMARLQPKFDLVHKCKLDYLISNQDHVVPDPYWEGFAEELEQDPDQTHLYDKVMRARQFAAPGSINHEPSLPTSYRGAHELGEQSNGPQARLDVGGVGFSETTSNVGENPHQPLDSHAAFILGQQSQLPAEDNSQDREASLQGRVQQLEEENARLKRYIDLVHQQFAQVEQLIQPLQQHVREDHEHEAGE